jgi:DNA-binding response OmpR family regulator
MSKPDQSAAATRLIGLKVLVVEDEPVTSLSLEDMLKALGCSLVLHASGVTEASAIIRDDRPDAAVLDLYLAGELAYPVARWLDAEKIPFVFTIGYGRRKVLGHWASRPAIQKPVTMKALRTKLEAALDQRSS